jgi:hypothetical protein
MTEEELNRFLMGEGGVGRGSDKVSIPSFGQPAPGLIPALPAMPTIDQAAPAMQPASSFEMPKAPTPIADSVGQYSQVNPMMEQQSLTPSEPSFAPTPVTNVGLMGEPLREQPSVEEIRRRANQTGIFGKPLPPGAIENNQENIAGFQGFLSGLGRGFTDLTGSKMQAERYGVPAPAETQISMSNPMMQQQPIMSSTPMVDSAVNYGVGPFNPGAIDFSKPPTTNVPGGTAQPSGITMGADGVINLPALTRESPLGSVAPEATFLRADGSIGEIFPGQRIGDAFPGNPDTPLVGSPLVPGQQTYQGADLPGGTGFVRAPEGMVKTIGPDGKMIFATQEQANAIASSMNGPSSAGPVTPSAPGPAAPGGPAGQESRLDAMGLNMDSLRQLGRDAIAGPKAAYRYFTDPSQPTFGEVVKDVSEEQGTGPGFEVKAQPSAIPQGQPGSIQRNFTDRMATGQPLTDNEIASAVEFARSKGLNFDPATGYSQAPAGTAPQGSPRIVNSEGFSVPRGGPLGPVTLPRGSGANQPTLSSVNAMTATAPMATAPQGRPALSAYEQASMDREGRIAERDIRPGETRAQADTRIAQSRTQGANRGGQLSQSDLRDLSKGSAKGASTGDRARALEIQQRYGMGAFETKPTTDKLSQATSMVDRMISNGQLSPEKRNAAIQKIVGVGAGSAGAGSAGTGAIGSAEFDRVSSQLQEGGSLYNMGIRVDPSVVDPLTGAAQIYREKPGLEFGPPERLPVSQELMQQLLPYARSVRQGGTMTQDFANMGMQVNQFAGSK